MSTDRERSHTTPSAAWAGWVGFAGIMLALIGFFDILQGLTALFNDEYFTVRNGDLLVFDFTAWGWITLIWGLLLVSAGLGLLAGRGWARRSESSPSSSTRSSRSRSSLRIRSGRRSSSRSTCSSPPR